MEFTNNERYHIFNRGVEKINIFKDKHDYQRFLLGMKEFNTSRPIGSLRDKLQVDKIKSDRVSSPVTFCSRGREQNSTGFEAPSSKKSKGLVKVIAYCLNPNHYHLILEQVEDAGISRFIKKLSSSHTAYFNKRYGRSGSLFQGKFKAVHIDSNEYLLYLSAYVNKNNFIHGGTNERWPYSSWLDYIDNVGRDTVSTFIPAGFCRDWISAYYTCEKGIVLDQFGGSVEEYKKFVEMNADYLKKKKMLAKYLLE